MNDHINVVKFLVQKGVNIDSKTTTDQSTALVTFFLKKKNVFVKMNFKKKSTLK